MRSFTKAEGYRRIPQSPKVWLIVLTNRLLLGEIWLLDRGFKSPIHEYAFPFEAAYGMGPAKKGGSPQVGDPGRTPMNWRLPKMVLVGGFLGHIGSIPEPCLGVK